MRVERRGDLYVLLDEHELWTIELVLDTSGSPFREQLVWLEGGVVAIGGGGVVHFASLKAGTTKARLELAGDRFGSFALDAGVLYVLGWRRVTAIASDLTTRWVSDDIAVDGIVWGDRDGDRIRLSAELDPPGGWVPVELDANTGRITGTR